MADKTIGSLPQAKSLTDASSFVCEDSGEAKRVTGKQFKDFAKEGATQAAEAAAKSAQQAAESAAVYDDVVIDVTQLKQDLIPIHNNAPTILQISFSKSSQNTDSDFRVLAGMKYYLKCLNTDVSRNVLVMVKGNNNYYKPVGSATGKVEFIPVSDGTLRFYNQSNGYIGTVTFELIPAVIADIANMADNSLSGYKTMATTAESLSALTDGSKSCDDFPDNKIICVGNTGLGLRDYPSQLTKTGLGVYLTMKHNYSSNDKNGKIQFCVYDGLAVRMCFGGKWYDWAVLDKKEKVYYVGGSSGNSSLTSLLLKLKNDSSPKTIFVNPGTYDIFSEYQAEVSNGKLSIPPDDVSISDYLDRCVFLPPNTKLIGLGNVILQWAPQKEDITIGAARAWSPLNVRYACYVENIEIRAKYARYCIHDDSHNASDDQGVEHIYKNVRCYFESNSDGYGTNNPIGFGFSDKTKYLFEDCHFEVDSANSAFYGHGPGSGNVSDGASVLVKSTVIKNTGGNAVRLQGLNTTLLCIKALFANCYISSGFRLQNDAGSNGKSAFDVTLLKSGTPTIYNDYEVNPYTVKVFN